MDGRPAATDRLLLQRCAVRIIRTDDKVHLEVFEAGLAECLKSPAGAIVRIRAAEINEDPVERGPTGAHRLALATILGPQEGIAGTEETMGGGRDER
jgi:hypothetical protein